MGKTGFRNFFFNRFSFTPNLFNTVVKRVFYRLHECLFQNQSERHAGKTPITIYCCYRMHHRRKTNEVTSQYGRQNKEETSLKNLIRYKLPPSPTLGVFSRPKSPTQSLSTKQAQFHPVPIKTQRGPKKRGI